jgi:hypothetical protein
MEILGYQFKEEIRTLIREEIAGSAPAEEPKSLPLEIVNQKGLCQRFDLSEPTVIRWRNKGIIPFMQLGSAIRYDVNEVAKALEAGSKKRVTK